MHFDTTGLSPMAIGRLNKALDTRYSFDGVVMTLRSKVEQMTTIKKEESDSMINWNRRHSNRLGSNKEQAEYEARLKAKRLYFINDIKVPKIVYDAVQP